MKRYYQEISTVIIILVLGIIFQKNYINEFPSHIHAWAQSDRYAIALRFADNDLNFFKPETFVYNHQFPHDMQVPAKKTITAVDFPIHDFIPAIFMKLFHNNAPWIFRFYILLYSFVGLFIAFKLAKLMTNDFIKSVFVILFMATSPVFVYYQAGFLPTIPSLSNAIIGIYFYICFLQHKKRKFINLSILFLTLAALSRTTFAIPLIAVFGNEFLRIIKREARIKEILLPALFSITALLSYFLYNSYLRNEYGSIFLNHILPATSIEQVFEILSTIKQKWGFQYFTAVHYVAILTILALLIITALTGKINVKRIDNQFIILTSIIFIGCFLFASLMLRQFPAHDYYFLDTFFLPIIMTLIFLLSFIPMHKSNWSKVISFIAILVILIPMINKAANTQKVRREEKPWDKTATTIANFQGSEEFLDSIGIPADAKMLVLDAQAPNIPFMLMNRKGFAVMSNNKAKIEDILNWDYDYIITQNNFLLSDIYSSHPEIISKMNKVYDNGKISVNRFRNDTTKQELYEYLGLDKQKHAYKEQVDFENQPNDNWSNYSTTNQLSYSGKHGSFLSGEQKYGLTFFSSNMPLLKEKECILLFQSRFLQDSVSNAKIVVTITEDGENSYYEAIDLNARLRKPNTWEQINLLFNLPRINSEDYELRLYIMNANNSEMYYDDFGFKIY